MEAPFCEETIYVTPSRLSYQQRELIVRTAAEAARVLGLRHGPLHAELRLNDEGAWPVDIAARSIGGICSRTLRFGEGASLEDLLLRHATGGSLEGFEREPGSSGVMMIPIPVGGGLRAGEGLERARTLRHIESIEIAIRPGQRVVPLPEGGEYLGFIFARADDPAVVEQSLREAHHSLEFIIEVDGSEGPLSAGVLRVPLN